jgi:minor extracellular protease Epr
MIGAGATMRTIVGNKATHPRAGLHLVARLHLAIALCVAVAPALAAKRTLAPSDLPLGPSVSSGPTFKVAATTAPVISGYIYPKATRALGCVRLNDDLTILGKGFGSAKGKSVALAGHGLHVDLTVRSWTNTRIVARVPKDKRIKEGQQYHARIERADHKQWLSKIGKSFNICVTAARTTEPRTAPSPEPLREEKPATGPSDYPEPGPRQPPILGGSLMDSPLPPPPEDLPEPSARDDDSVEPDEIVLVTVTMQDAQALAQSAGTLGFSIRRRYALSSLGIVVTVFRVPQGVGVNRALVVMRQALPEAWVDVNHRYQLQGKGRSDPKHYGQDLIKWGGASPTCGSRLRIGLVDTAVDTNHGALRGQRLQTRSFLTPGIRPAPTDHGTATAALLIGSAKGIAATGLLPGATLYAADVFRQRSKRHVDTTAELVARGIDWLISQGVTVINLSLGGPRNLLIEAAVSRALGRGVIIVAAAGNSGSKAPPVYPAAQKGVVAVTAVDAKLKPYKRANRGEYIDFAAPGVDVWTAKSGGGGSYVSGTSYAAPFVTAAIGATQTASPRAPWSQLRKQIETSVRDLGKPGRDPVYGWGLVQLSSSCR